jgi:hypothetical protein
MADLNRPGGQAIDLGRLPGQAPATLGFKVAKRDQALEVLEGDRAMDPDGAGDVLDTSWLPVGIEAEQDVASGEIPEGAERPLHLRSHEWMIGDHAEFSGYCADNPARVGVLMALSR